MTKEEIKAIINEAVAMGIKEHVAACPIPLDAQKQIGHFFGVVTDLGDGDIRKGVEVLRNHHKFISNLTNVRNKLGNTILGVFIALLTTGLLTLLSSGFREVLKKIFTSS
jgi:hypothetical protein